MAKYVYTALLTPADEGGYLVTFPQLENCFTDGDDLNEALTNAEDALSLMLYTLEEEGTPAALSGTALDIPAPEGGFATLIHCDTMEYRRMYENKAVKKTLTIPSWLNATAERAGVNFSQVLQEALTERLGL